MNDLKTLDDGKPRCSWGAATPDYVAYHDDEWGRAMIDRNRLFEKLSLEGFQAGLSWLTILRKRESFRSGFAGFEPEAVAEFDEGEVARLLADPGIVRHQGKIRSVINNARRLPELERDVGPLPSWLWSEWADRQNHPPRQIPSITPASTRLSARLKKAGFTFVGPTTVYAFMQAMGLVNDHREGCFARPRCSAERAVVIDQL